MALPTAEALQLLKQRIVEKLQMNQIMGCYHEALSGIELSLGGVVVSGLQSAAGQGLNALTISGMGSALGPWFTVGNIAVSADSYMEWYDLKDSNTYSCSCLNCRDNIAWIIHKKDKKFMSMALGPFTAGIVPAIRGINSKIRSYDATSEKSKKCIEIHKNAREGCIKAMAIVFHLVDSNTWFGGNEKVFKRSAAIIAAYDGWEQIKSEI